MNHQSKFPNNYPDRGRKDEELHLMKLREEGSGDTCAMGTENVLSPTAMTLASMRVIAGSSNTKDRVKPSACQVEISSAKAEPTCN